MNEPTPSKSIFKSRAAYAGAVAAVAGALGTFFPNAAPLVTQYASGILLVSGVLNVGLRFLSHKRVTLWGD